MTDKTTPTQSAADIFVNLIVAFLAPMFLSAAGGDIQFARAAAVHTIKEYRVQSRVDLLLVAQIIAFGLAALGSLSLSMADDLSPSMVLRLRANAISANRASEQCRKALGEPCADTTSPLPPRPDDLFPDEAKIAVGTEQAREQASEPKARPQPQQPAPPPQSDARTDRQRRTLWAGAMTNVAAQIEADMPNLPPAQRREASMRAAALSSVANHLLTERDSTGQRSFHSASPKDPA